MFRSRRSRLRPGRALRIGLAGLIILVVTSCGRNEDVPVAGPVLDRQLIEAAHAGEGVTPLEHAQRSGYAEIAEILRRARAGG